jgi:hypothetical protein
MLGCSTNLDILKERYNEHYDTLVDELNKSYLKRLMNLPDSITGFYLHSGLNEISKVGRASHDNRFGVVYSEKQAKGMVAYCELSQILPVFNEGWEPQHSYETMKWCIQTSDHGINIYSTYLYNALLTFKTEEKAELFLKERIDLITDLSKAGII